MLKKTLTFETLDGDMVSRTFYFHLGKAKLLEVMLSFNGDYVEYLKSIINSGDNVKIFKTFKNLIGLSVGQKSDDGERFIQSPDYTSAFLDSEAFSEFICELMQNPNAAAEFISGIIPKSIRGDVDVQLAMKEAAKQIEQTPPQVATNDIKELAVPVADEEKNLKFPFDPYDKTTDPNNPFADIRDRASYDRHQVLQEMTPEEITAYLKSIKPNTARDTNDVLH